MNSGFLHEYESILVLICDQVNPKLNEILEKNGLQITYEPEITPEQIEEKIGNFEVVIVQK